MLRFDVLTLFPDIIRQGCSFSIIKRAADLGLIEVNAVNPRDYTLDKHRKVDDTPYGGGAGMLISCQPYLDALKSVKKYADLKIIMLTAQGRRFNQRTAEELSKKEQIIIMCGHYEGFDSRIAALSGAEEISIGDYILTGGELPALCIIDAASRLLKGVLGSEESIVNESYNDCLLEHPHYTKPRVYEGLEVPEILLSGNHEKINEWRRLQQFAETKEKRPDLFEQFLRQEHSDFDKKMLKKFYSVLNEMQE